MDPYRIINCRDPEGGGGPGLQGHCSELSCSAKRRVHLFVAVGVGQCEVELRPRITSSKAMRVFFVFDGIDVDGKGRSLQIFSLRRQDYQTDTWNQFQAPALLVQILNHFFLRSIMNTDPPAQISTLIFNCLFLSPINASTTFLTLRFPPQYARSANTIAASCFDARSRVSLMVSHIEIRKVFQLVARGPTESPFAACFSWKTGYDLPCRHAVRVGPPPCALPRRRRRADLRRAPGLKRPNGLGASPSADPPRPRRGARESARMSSNPVLHGADICRAALGNRWSRGTTSVTPSAGSSTTTAIHSGAPLFRRDVEVAHRSVSPSRRARLRRRRGSRCRASR